MSDSSPTGVVRAWHEALNRGDAEAVLRLSSADVEIVGEAEVASVFRVAEGRVASYARFDDLATALARAGLEESDAA